MAAPGQAPHLSFCKRRIVREVSGGKAFGFSPNCRIIFLTMSAFLDRLTSSAVAMSMLKILIVDDEPAIRDMIRMALELDGNTCLEAGSANEAMPLIVDERPDLIVLDWMMPEISGVELIRRLKRDEGTAEIPVIMLTAKVDEQNAVTGLDAGADDYITKPFRPRELISRIKAVRRRMDGFNADDSLEAAGLTLDPIGHRVFIDQQVVNMGPTEFKLLKFFMSHPERAYTRGQLLDQVWGSNVYVEERTVDVHIRRLRKALKPAHASQDYGHFIQTVRGTGYRFSVKLAI